MIITSKLKRPYFLYPLIFAASALIILSRRPDALLNPQFWAEDGKIWYADAYNHGVIYSLFTPEAGYFQTLSRLVGIISQAFQLEYGPLIFNLIAVVIQTIVVGFIVSGRLSSLIPRFRWRLLIAFVYLALPHSWEINTNITNSQWHLGLLSFLIIAAEPGKTLFWRIFDVSVIIISVVSGPLCLLLFPIAALKYWHRREKWLIPFLGILLFGGIVQTIALLTNARPTQAELGAGIGLFFKISFRHIFLSSIVGQGGFHQLMEYLNWNVIFIILVNLFGAFLVGYTLLKSRLELRLFILFSILIFAASLASPAVTPVDNQWEAMASHNTALRYWFIPGLCLIVSLLYLASSNGASAFVRYPAIAVLAILPFGIIKDWSNPKFADLHFSHYAEEFEKAPPGSEVAIPINPNWEMKLVKKD